jgi:Ca-activated chloride channel family protein
MVFRHPQLAWLFFLLVPGLVLLYLSGRSGRKRALESLAPGELREKLLPAAPGRREWPEALLTGLALSLCLLALMGPGWGGAEAGRQGPDILIALDASRSMLARDAGTSRLEAARSLARELAARAGKSRIGLVAFAGGAFLVCPLTHDRNGFLLSLTGLDTDALPRGGTSLAAAIDEAVRGVREGRGREAVLVMITDGENLEGDPLAAAVRARQAGITIHALGVGTPEGGPVVLPEGSGGETLLRDRQGRVVQTRLDEGLLARIAAAAGGQYSRAGSRGMLPDGAAKWLAQEEAGGEPAEGPPPREGFQLPLVMALLILLGERARIRK